MIIIRVIIRAKFLGFYYRKYFRNDRIFQKFQCLSKERMINRLETMLEVSKSGKSFENWLNWPMKS